jgi:hypothetical protein
VSGTNRAITLASNAVEVLVRREGLGGFEVRRYSTVRYRTLFPGELRPVPGNMRPF